MHKEPLALRSWERDCEKYDAMLARAASGETALPYLIRKPQAALSPKVWQFVLSILANVLHDDAKLSETTAFLTREYLR